MTDPNIEKYIPNSDENVKIEEDEENGFQPNQLNNIVVNSAENTPIEDSCEQIEHISGKSSEEDKNANPDVKDMQLLVQAIKSEHLPKSSGEIRKKRKSKKIKKIITMLRGNQSTEKACPHCDFRSNSPTVSSLVEHIMAKHKGVRWEWEYCGYKATQQSNLRRHIKYKHKGLRYCCPNCEKQLTTRSSLLRHMKSNYCGIN